MAAAVPFPAVIGKQASRHAVSYRLLDCIAGGPARYSFSVKADWKMVPNMAGTSPRWVIMMIIVIKI